MILDHTTLFALAISVTGLLGLFLLVLWFEERSVRALAWWGGAYLTGTCAVALWGAQRTFNGVPMALPNGLLFVACGMIWSGARLFHGRRMRPVAMFAGALAWFLAMQVPPFAASDQARTVSAGMVIALYAFLTAYELQRERRRELAHRWLGFAVPLLHSVVFLAPALLILTWPGRITNDGLFALFAVETAIYVVGTAFVVVVMAKERAALMHMTAAMTDLMTGLFNRRAFLEAATRLIGQRARHAKPVSVLLFDLDRFKSINDRFGHAIGDEALKVFADTVSSNLRSTDIVGRLGGDEFAAIIPGTAGDAQVVAERLGAAFQAAGATIFGHEIGATVSIGVATAVPPVAVDSLLVLADAALYRAKHNGRNRIEHDEGDSMAAPAASVPRDKGGTIAAARQLNVRLW